MNLSSHITAISSSAKSPIASQKVLGYSYLLGNSARKMRINSKSDAASSSEARLQDAYLGGLMEKATVNSVATKAESRDVDPSESQSGSEEDKTGRPIVISNGYGKNRMHSVNQTVMEVQKLKRYNGHTIHKFFHNHNSVYGSSILDRQGDLRTRTR